MGFTVFLFGFGEEIAVDSNSQSPVSNLMHQHERNHAKAALLLEEIAHSEESSNALLYVNYTYTNAKTGEVFDTVILL